MTLPPAVDSEFVKINERIFAIHSEIVKINERAFAMHSEIVKITDELICDMQTLRDLSENRRTIAELRRHPESDMYFGIRSHCVDRMEHTQSELKRIADEIRLLTTNLEPDKEKASGTKHRVRYHEYNIKGLGNASGICSEIFAVTWEIVHDMKILRELSGNGMATQGALERISRETKKLLTTNPKPSNETVSAIHPGIAEITNDLAEEMMTLREFSGNRLTIRSELERIAREIRELLTPNPMPSETASAIHSDVAEITNWIAKSIETLPERLDSTAEDSSLYYLTEDSDRMEQMEEEIRNQIANARDELIQISARVAELLSSFPRK